MIIHKLFLHIRIRSCSVSQLYYPLSKTRNLNCSACAFSWGSPESVERDSLSFRFSHSHNNEVIFKLSAALPTLSLLFPPLHFPLLFLTLFCSFFSLLFDCLLASSRLRSPSMIALTLSSWNPPRFGIFRSGFVALEVQIAVVKRSTSGRVRSSMSILIGPQNLV